MTEKHAYPKCKICGGWHRGVEHEFGAKSTAARMDVQVTEDPPLSGSDEPESPLRTTGFVGAGTQAPPVDTNSASVDPAHRRKAEGVDAQAAPSATLSELGALADAASARIAAKPKGQRGRPPNGFDKKTHDRLRAAERRAKAKASP